MYLNEELEADLCQAFQVWVAEDGVSRVSEGLDIDQAQVSKQSSLVRNYAYLRGPLRQRMEMRWRLAKSIGAKVGDTALDETAKTLYEGSKGLHREMGNP